MKTLLLLLRNRLSGVKTYLSGIALFILGGLYMAGYISPDALIGLATIATGSLGMALRASITKMKEAAKENENV